MERADGADRTTVAAEMSSGVVIQENQENPDNHENHENEESKENQEDQENQENQNNPRKTFEQPNNKE